MRQLPRNSTFPGYVYLCWERPWSGLPIGGVQVHAGRGGPAGGAYLVLRHKPPPQGLTSSVRRRRGAGALAHQHHWGCGPLGDGLPCTLAPPGGRSRNLSVFSLPVVPADHRQPKHFLHHQNQSPSPSLQTDQWQPVRHPGRSTNGGRLCPASDRELRRWGAGRAGLESVLHTALLALGRPSSNRIPPPLTFTI